MHLGHTASGLLLLATTAACAPSDGELTTEHLDIRAESEICAGTIASLDAESLRISETLGLDWTSRLRLGFGEELIDEHCVGAGEIADVAGCARGFGEETEVYADLFSSSHELVHGLRRQHGLRGPPFFSEGLAELVGSRRPFSAQVLLVDPTMVSRGPADLAFDVEVVEEHYRVGAHFLAWLAQRDGEAAMLSFLRDPAFEIEPADPEAVARAFSTHFGDDLAAADQQWRQTAGVRYEWGQWCPDDRWLDPSGDEIVAEGDFDCSQEDTLGPPSLHHLPWCLSLAEPANLRVAGDLEQLDVSIGLIGCSDGAGTGPPFHDKFIEAGATPQDLEFGACDWWIRIGNPEGLTAPYRLVLSRDGR